MGGGAVLRGNFVLARLNINNIIVDLTTRRLNKNTLKVNNNFLLTCFLS